MLIGAEGRHTCAIASEAIRAAGWIPLLIVLIDAEEQTAAARRVLH
jgi:hypothetical protein